MEFVSLLPTVIQYTLPTRAAKDHWGEADGREKVWDICPGAH